MSEGGNFLAETPAELPLTCGFCYPDLDFDTYVHQFCSAHSPDLSGADDALAKRLENPWLSGNAEAGGVGNQAVCEQIHHTRRA